MFFNTFPFFVFFSTLAFLYFFLSPKYRWILLLVASYYFYMCFKIEYIAVIFTSTAVSYVSGIELAKTNSANKKKLILLICIAVNLSMLLGFKYFNFINDSVKDVFGCFNIVYQIPSLTVLLPIGISFYTLKSLSYIIDVYSGKMKAEKHFGRFALYVSFFPQIVSGPIDRATDLLPQLHTDKQFDYSQAADGLRLILWGLFKKIVIADNLAVVVNRVYNHVYDYSGMHYIIATVFFTFQIYCDFSGYTDIAIGCSQVLGFNIKDNFRRPYFSKSVSEFWRRWHISLTSWFRDYVYIPLGGSRVGSTRRYWNLFFVFLLSGLWHGASWTFVVWGAVNGLYLIFSILTQRMRETCAGVLQLYRVPLFHKCCKIVFTFLLISFAWIFFRAKNISEAFYIVSHLHSGVWTFFTSLAGSLVSDFSLSPVKAIIISLKISGFHFIIMTASIFVLLVFDFLQRPGGIGCMLRNKHFLLRWAIYYFLFFGIFFFGNFQTKQFIYAQF